MAVTDDFNRANSGTLGANWTATANNMAVASNSAQASASVENFDYYSGVSWNSDHTSQAVYRENASDTIMYLTVRHQPGGDWYGLLLHSIPGDRRINFYKRVGGVVSDLGGIAGRPTDGNTFKLEIVGTTLSAYDNGVLIDDVVVSDLTGGAPGIGSEIPGAAWDDWEGTGESGGGGGGCVRKLAGYGGGLVGPARGLVG